MDKRILDVLDNYTYDRRLSQHFVEKYENFFDKVKLNDFHLEDLLKIIPYVEKLKIASLDSIIPFLETKVPNDLQMMIAYLLFRAKLGAFMTINILTQPVTQKINSLFLDVFPNNVPKLFKDGLHIQAKNSPLYDNVIRIILYTENDLDGKSGFTIVLFRTDMRYVWATFTYSSILGTVAEEIDILLIRGISTEEETALFKKGVKFCFIFSILLEAEKTPTVIKIADKSTSLKNMYPYKPEKRITDGWIERTVYIDKKYLSSKQKEVNATLYKDNKVLKKVTVREHLRRKPNSSEYIYIESFTATRWVMEGDKKITYYLKQDE